LAAWNPGDVPGDLRSSGVAGIATDCTELNWLTPQHVPTYKKGEVEHQPLTKVTLLTYKKWFRKWFSSSEKLQGISKSDDKLIQICM
jgi:hypothetical protein